MKDLDVYVCGLCGNPMVQCPLLMSPSAMIEFLKKLKTFSNCWPQASQHRASSNMIGSASTFSSFSSTFHSQKGSSLQDRASCLEGPTGKVTVTKQREFRFVPRRLNLCEKWAAEVQNPSRSRWCYIQYLTYCSQQLIISNWGPL